MPGVLLYRARMSTSLSSRAIAQVFFLYSFVFLKKRDTMGLEINNSSFLHPCFRPSYIYTSLIRDHRIRIEQPHVTHLTPMTKSPHEAENTLQLLFC